MKVPIYWAEFRASALSSATGPRKRTALNNLRNLALWIVIALLLVVLFNLFQGPTQRAGPRADFLQRIQPAGECRRRSRSVTIQGDHIEGQLQERQPDSPPTSPDDPSLVQRLLEHNVDITVTPR